MINPHLLLPSLWSPTRFVPLILLCYFLPHFGFFLMIESILLFRGLIPTNKKKTRIFFVGPTEIPRLHQQWVIQSSYQGPGNKYYDVSHPAHPTHVRRCFKEKKCVCVRGLVFVCSALHRYSSIW